MKPTARRIRRPAGTRSAEAWHRHRAGSGRTGRVRSCDKTRRDPGAHRPSPARLRPGSGPRSCRRPLGGADPIARGYDAAAPLEDLPLRVGPRYAALDRPLANGLVIAVQLTRGLGHAFAFLTEKFAESHAAHPNISLGGSQTECW